MKVTHEFGPVYYKDSKILILGTIPSVKSREYGFYYMHPQNRFWKTISKLFDEEIPNTIQDKKHFLKKHKIALWDVLESCDIKGSSDSTIINPKVNDIDKLIKNTKIKKVFVTGKKAQNLYNKYLPNSIPPIYLPSTSPANRKISDNELLEAYKIILEYL